MTDDTTTTETDDTEAPESRERAWFELYTDAAGEYRWRLKAPNGQVIAVAGEGYTRKHDALLAIDRVRDYSRATDDVRDADLTRTDRLRRAKAKLKHLAHRAPGLVGSEEPAPDTDSEEGDD